MFPDPDLYPLSEVPLDGLSGFNIVLSGYWEVPTQETQAQVRQDHEVEADAALYEMAGQISHAGAKTDIRLEFGPGGLAERRYQNQLADELGANAILLATQVSSLLNILVPLRDSRHQEEIVDYISAFDPDSVFIVELYHVAADESAIESGRAMLESVAQTLRDRGFSDADLECTVEVAADPKAAIMEFARDHHLVVMGETEKQDIEGELFGPVCTYIAAESQTPIAVVQD